MGLGLEIVQLKVGQVFAGDTLVLVKDGVPKLVELGRRIHNEDCSISFEVDFEGEFELYFEYGTIVNVLRKKQSGGVL